MKNTRISDELSAFLDAEFPRSTLDDGYYFVRIEAPAARVVHRGRLQPIADKLSEDRSWLVVVGADPRPVLPSDHFEERDVYYRPDWDVDERMSQWVAELQDTKVPLAPLIALLKPAHALAIVNADKRIILNLGTARVYAPSQADLDRFATGIEDSFDDWPRGAGN